MNGQTLLCIVLCYLIGSLPTAYLITRLVAGIDIRHVGNGNVGARNTFRQVSKWAGIAVGAIDIAKGCLAVLLARRFQLGMVWMLAAGAAAVLGHDFTLFLHFHGGQGMATAIGVLLAVLPCQTCVGLCVAAAARWVFRRTFDQSMAVGLGMVPVLAWSTDQPLELVLYPVVLLPTIGLRKLAQMNRLSAQAVNGEQGAQDSHIGTL